MDTRLDLSDESKINTIINSVLDEDEIQILRYYRDEILNGFIDFKKCFDT